MGIRVIGGEFGGRRLATGDLPGLRPTTDRVRETIFNILASRIDFDGVRGLDLCAGSGALGIEALSRGLKTCDFVEKNRKTAVVLKGNVESLGLEERARILTTDALTALKRAAEGGDEYDLILSDPPYRAPFLPKLIESVHTVMKADALFVLERSVEFRIVTPPSLTPVLERTFGTSALSIFARSAS